MEQLNIDENSRGLVFFTHTAKAVALTARRTPLSALPHSSALRLNLHERRSRENKNRINMLVVVCFCTHAVTLHKTVRAAKGRARHGSSRCAGSTRLAKQEGRGHPTCSLWPPTPKRRGIFGRVGIGIERGPMQGRSGRCAHYMPASRSSMGAWCVSSVSGCQAATRHAA